MERREGDKIRAGFHKGREVCLVVFSPFSSGCVGKDSDQHTRRKVRSRHHGHTHAGPSAASVTATILAFITVAIPGAISKFRDARRHHFPVFLYGYLAQRDSG